MTEVTLEDYHWLVSAQGRRWLGEIECDAGSLVQLTTRLRKQLPPGRVHLLLEQLDLRRRARRKFKAAERMFFTRRALEQATDDAIARYKATRFEVQHPVADLCCGIGGDLLALGRGGTAVGIDNDAVMTLLAQANAKALGLELVSATTQDAATFSVREYRAWHLDPDRRVSDRRTSQPSFAHPSWLETVNMLRTNENAAIKLAPAARLPDDFAARVERQWIGSRRECRQQLIWSGELAHHSGRRSVCVVDDDCGASRQLVELAPRPRISCGTLRSYVHDPHAAVLAAGLLPELAQRFRLQRFEPEVAYLTSDKCVLDPLVATFEVHATLPLDVRRLRATLKEHDFDPLEIKKRNVSIEPRVLRKQLQRCGTRPVTLIITKHQGQVVVMITKRCREDSVRRRA